LARQRAITASRAGGTRGASARTRGGWASTCCRITSYQSSPGKGSTPVAARKSVTPSAYWSLRTSSGSPRACSGEKYGRRAEEHLAAGRRGRAGHRARDPEVGDHGAPVGGEEDVLGLDVAVDDPGAVREREPARDLGAHARHVLGRERARAGEPVGERRRQVVHHEVRRARRRAVERSGAARP
jgi:hypothetical protein